MVMIYEICIDVDKIYRIVDMIEMFASSSMVLELCLYSIVYRSDSIIVI